MNYKQYYNDYLTKIKQKGLNIRDKLLDEHPYEEMSNYNPLKPLSIWGHSNRQLEEFYNRPEINITNSKDDKNLKNSMRHIVGLANTMQEYKNPFISNLFGGVKEIGDVLRLNLDNKLDWENNQRGINYASYNPNFTKEDILNFAYREALKNYKNDYGYEHPRIEKEVYGTVIK